MSSSSSSCHTCGSSSSSSSCHSYHKTCGYSFVYDPCTGEPIDPCLAELFQCCGSKCRYYYSDVIWCTL